MNPQLPVQLRHLRLSGMAQALPVRLEQAQSAPLGCAEFLELLVEDELTRRADRLFARRLKAAGILQVKDLSDFDWTFNPKIPRAKLVELTPHASSPSTPTSCSSDRPASARATSPRLSPSAPSAPATAP